ncbi:MAG TPA: prolyl oligopeptidase family serine peptidase, partial [Rhizomicrobium sp.]|nr:prolyl oligopeptidase family serine peptidase [Rhizomicrobium sp.]
TYMLGQGKYARSAIDRIPGRGRLESRVAKLSGAGAIVRGVQTEGGLIFFQKREPSESTYKLFVRDAATGGQRMLVDPDRWSGENTHYAIDWFLPSQHGEKIICALSAGGSEHSVIHVLDVASGRALPETIDRAEFGGVSWLPDASGFFYNRMAKTGPNDPDTAHYLNSRALLHRLGANPDGDVALIGTNIAGSPKVVPSDQPAIFVQPGTDRALAMISHGSEPAIELLVAPLAEAVRPGAHWRKFADSPDGVINVALHGNSIYLLTHKDAPRYRIVALDPGTLDWAHARTVVPESGRVIIDAEPASDGLYIRDLDGGIGRLRMLDWQSGKVHDIVLPVDGTVNGPNTDPLQPGAYFSLQSWLLPEAWYAVQDGRVAPLNLVPKWQADTSAFVSEETRIKARDGTMVPLSIVHRKDLVRDGKAPLWLTGYGSYSIAMQPRYLSGMLALLQDGGVYAACHVRGGGEFGEAWHKAGMQATKPNTWRDLIDCAKYLQGNGYASPATTGIEGGSAGGITVGMALVEEPNLFRAVMSDVGDSNALRAEFETDGDANALEYGSVKTEPGFRALLAMDALSHVKDGLAYPAVLFTTGLNDPHVAPWQPGKMAARLQKATSSRRPILLLVDTDAGHGAGPTKQQLDRQVADHLAFLYWQTGKPGYQPTK